MLPLSLAGAEAIIFAGTSELNTYYIVILPHIFSSLQIALLIYDYALTFKDEVQCIWQRGFSGVTVTFVLLRYGTILDSILEGVYLAGNVGDTTV